VATYKANTIETPAPKLPALQKVDLPKDYTVMDDVDSEAALNDLVEPWVTQSNGRSQTASVEGGALAAIAALGPRQVLVAELSPRQALAHMAWAAASGGAHGDRRGAAAGRYLAWWVVASLADIEWPAPPDEIRNAAERMRWLWFDDKSPPGGWALRLAVADLDLGLAWSVSASDIAD
jgi:hypothetical protein